jgi:rhodanese-related sulfurtransferase
MLPRKFRFVGVGILLLLINSDAIAVHAGLPDVQIKDLRYGFGDEVVRHSTVSVEYTGWLEDGTRFDSSEDREDGPLTFKIGAGSVIPGWDLGIPGMKVGGVRELTIPPELAYGKRGVESVIPPDETLRFEVEVLEANAPPYKNVDNEVSEAMRGRGVQIVDIRRPEEWDETGIVEGSILLTAFDKNGRLIPDFPQSFTKNFGNDEEVLLICRTGNRTSVIADALASQAGYNKIYNVVDGIEQWIAEGRPVVKR